MYSIVVYDVWTDAKAPPEIARESCVSADDARRAIIRAAAGAAAWIGGDALHGPVDRAIAHGRAVVTAVPGRHIVVTREAIS